MDKKFGYLNPKVITSHFKYGLKGKPDLRAFVSAVTYLQGGIQRAVLTWQHFFCNFNFMYFNIKEMYLYHSFCYSLGKYCVNFVIHGKNSVR